MAEDINFSTVQSQDHDGPNSTDGSTKISCRAGKTDVWPRADLSQQKQKQFSLSGDSVATRLQGPDLTGISGTSFVLPSCQAGDGNFDYQKEMQSLDMLSAQLDSVRQQLMADILRCQLLQVDLATQFDPSLVQQLRATKLSCERCEGSFDEPVTIVASTEMDSP